MAKRSDCDHLSISQPSFWLGNGTTQFGGRFNPFIYHLFNIGQNLLIGGAISGASRQLRNLGDTGSRAGYNPAVLRPQGHDGGREGEPEDFFAGVKGEERTEGKGIIGYGF